MSDVLISVLPYILSFPVTDSILCGAKIGSGHLISSHLGTESLHCPVSKQILLGTPFNLCADEHEYETSEPRFVVF